jgi:hypothetical protein
MENDESLTRIQLEQMLAAQKRAEISAQRNALLHGMELRLAELIGVDGDGGEIAAFSRRIVKLEETNMEMQRNIDSLTLFKHKILWLIGAITAIGSVTGTIAVLIVQHFLR